MNELVLPPGSGVHSFVNGQLQPRERGIVSVRRAIGVVQSKWRLAALSAAITFVVVAAGGLLMPRQQYAEATLIIHPVSGSLAQPENPQSAMPPDTSAIDTEVEVLRSAGIAQSVVRKLKLYEEPEFGGSPATQPNDEAMRRVVAAVEGNSRIRRVGLTYVVQVGFLAATTAKAKWIADGIVDAYMARKLDEKLAEMGRANRDLGATLGGLRDQALQSESRVEAYEAQNNLLGANGTSLTEAELSALNQQIAGAQADSAEKNARLAAALAQARSGSGGSDVGATLASDTIGALRQKEADSSAALARLNTEFRPDYPLVKKASAELQDIQSQLKSETTRILSSLRADADAASRREASLESSRQQTESKLATNDRSRAGLLTLQQAADSSKKIYETYLTRASEVSAARSLQQVDATVEARAIAAPASPFTSLRFILAMAIFLAIVAGLVATAIAEMWVRRIRSWNDVMSETGLPVAGIVPDVAALSRARDAAGHIVSNPLTACAESFRNLRAYLALAAPEGHSKIIAVTSAVPGEGKTMTSVCLARTFAATGSRVVLLDCDLRRASASKFFTNPQFGIAEIVTRSIPIDQALVQDSKSGIWFLSGTSTNDISGDLFSSARIDELLARLSERFDKIIIDTSPVLGFADARILASKADCVLHVVHWDKTPASIVHAAVQILRQSNARVAGIVLNKVNIKQQARYGFADGSDYYHYYGSAYAQQG
jgi:capsular exopolysaccharide synthesis family protein